jgi:hypothetical protein
MKKIIVSGLVMVATLAGLSACDVTAEDKKTGDTPSVALRTSVGDGIWKVGDKIAAGLWQPKLDWKSDKDCVWFVNPDGPTSAKAKGIPGVTSIRLKDGDEFSTVGCGPWEKTGS